MKSTLHKNRTGLLLVATLLALTLAGHLVTQRSGATPVIPVAGGGIDFASPGAGIDFASPGGGGVSFTGTLDRTAVMSGGDGLVKMELVLAAAEDRDPVAAARRGPTATDFLVILDRSGSMDGEKIVQARAAVRELISQLGEGDRFGLVTYADGAVLAIPMTRATPEMRARWRHVVARVQPGGGTDMSSGMDLAQETLNRPLAGRAARVILISDGLANQGDSSLQGLSNRAARSARGEVVVSTVGVGDDFNELLMSAVADAGTGNYYYLDDVEMLAQVFLDELAVSRETVASALAVTIEPGPGVRVVDAAGYPLERRGTATTFRPGSLFAGQERRVWVTLRVPDEAAGEYSLGSFTATYSRRGVTHVLELAEEPSVACVVDQTRYLESFDGDAWARSVTEEDYNHLQQQVAGDVRAGNREQALQKIERFRIENEQLNLVMRRTEVKRKLEELQRLQVDVEESFEGADQDLKQNRLSKTRQAAGRDGRRMGSKRSGGSSRR